MFKVFQIEYRVKKLKEAVHDFEKMGFEVEWGSNPKTACTAYIKFINGPMIDLFVIPSIAFYLSYFSGIVYGTSARKRWQKWCRKKEGICDFNIKSIQEKSNSIRKFNDTCAWVNDNIMKMNRVMNGKRKDFSGNLIEFKYCMPQVLDFPLMASDYSSGNNANIRHAHKNGATEISKIVLGVPRKHVKIMKRLLESDERINIVESTKTEIREIYIKGLKIKHLTGNTHGIKIIGEDK